VASWCTITSHFFRFYDDSCPGNFLASFARRSVIWYVDFRDFYTEKFTDLTSGDGLLVFLDFCWMLDFLTVQWKSPSEPRLCVQKTVIPAHPNNLLPWWWLWVPSDSGRLSQFILIASSSLAVASWVLFRKFILASSSVQRRKVDCEIYSEDFAVSQFQFLFFLRWVRNFIADHLVFKVGWIFSENWRPSYFAVSQFQFLFFLRWLREFISRLLSASFSVQVPQNKSQKWSVKLIRRILPQLIIWTNLLVGGFRKKWSEISSEDFDRKFM